MNIQEAREEICRTILAYTRKNEDGSYRIPAVKQRPVLLIGPPGIGKTAIMEQAARLCGVGLVAYTITHHTRQSAIGLPVIREKNYGGKICSVTEYTMSEIIASIYDHMEETGEKEGILFIDEINCVSETLAPAMLQFLQCKTFGSHQVPEGWIIVAAGNPAGYNKSVREFDVVTLDRVRLLNVDADLDVWKQYAREQGIHESILSFLEIKPQDFYRMESFEEGKQFVTARGWEDLSRMLQVYEELELPVSADFVQEFLQYPMVAADFAAYYALYRKYQSDYGIDSILAGSPSREICTRAAAASYEERITLVHLLFEMLLNRTEKESEKSKDGVHRAVETGSAPDQSSDSGSASDQSSESSSASDQSSDSGSRADRESLAQDWNHAFRFLESCFGKGLELRVFVSEIQKSAVCASWLLQENHEEYLAYCGYFQQEDRQRKQEERNQKICELLT